MQLRVKWAYKALVSPLRICFNMRMYRSRSRYSAYRGGKVSYLMPFLIIISLGVVLVLAFSLFKSLFGEDLRKGAYLHMVEGAVQMRTWGTDQFFDLTSDALILQGDEVKTSADAKVIVEFFDGTIMRIAGYSDVIFTTIAEDSDGKSFEILLVDGNLWFNKVYKDVRNTKLVVKTADVVVASNVVGIFNIANDFEDIVRVSFGPDILLEVLDQDGNIAVADEMLGVGQMALFNSEALEKYRKFQSPNAVFAIEDSFKSTDWYLWNDAEDKSPTQFVKFDGKSAQFLEVQPEMKTPVLSEGNGGSDVDMKPAEPAELSGGIVAVSTPVIVSVAGIAETNDDDFYLVKSRVATLTGTVSGADKVIVNGYTLQKFKSGDSSWSYFANADFGLMKPGENIYEVYALAIDGKKSESIFVKVFYEPQEVPSATVDVVSGDNGESSVEANASDSLLESGTAD